MFAVSVPWSSCIPLCWWLCYTLLLNVPRQFTDTYSKIWHLHSFILHERFCAWENMLMHGLQGLCEDGKSPPAPRTVVLNILYHLRRLVVSWHHTPCTEWLLILYTWTYSGQLKVDQINNSTSWACGLELLTSDCLNCFLNCLVFVCLVYLLTELCCDSEATQWLPDSVQHHHREKRHFSWSSTTCTIMTKILKVCM